MIRMKKIVKIERNEKYGNVVSSRIIANELGKMHKTILRDIDNISISTDLSRLIYPSNYKDSRNRTYREYLFTKDGFILYMFNIQGHIDFKMAYINEFCTTGMVSVRYQVFQFVFFQNSV